MPRPFYLPLLVFKPNYFLT